MEHADKLIEMNKKNYEHDVPKIDNGDVMLDQFFYISGQGKKRSYSTKEATELNKEADVNKGTKEKLAKLELFGDNSQSSGEAMVKQECPQFP